MQDGLYSRERIMSAEADDAKRMLKHNIQVNWRWAADQLIAAVALDCFIEFDVGILKDIAGQVVRWETTKPEDRKYIIPFSINQLRLVQDRLPKYVGQLLKAMKEAK